MSVIIVIKSTYNSVQSHTTFSDSIHPVAKLRLCSRIIIHINASWTEKERIILRLLSASGIVVAWKQLLYSPPSSNTHQFPPRSAAVGVDGMGRSIFWMSAGSEYLHKPLLAWTILARVCQIFITTPFSFNLSISGDLGHFLNLIH